MSKLEWIRYRIGNEAYFEAATSRYVFQVQRLDRGDWWFRVKYVHDSDSYWLHPQSIDCSTARAAKAAAQAWLEAREAK